jgi:N-acetylmuramoyl-L-alanine amidase
MARWTSATWDPISGDLGNYSSGPYKIVHHTTEGETYSGARQAYAANASDPHFTVDETTVYQHIDTARVARALRNDPGGVETNRASAVQIEVVGFAGRPKSPQTLANVARLCRWIEQTHGVPQTWPNGHPREPLNGQDPGGHNRDATNWTTRSGHYGHSQVPENTHWDPAYTRAELAVVTPGG